MASSSIVIKVKFGESLRRFNAVVSDQALALDVITLREKIRSLFSFAPDVDFTLTYIDEDGDVVTLADEDDLHDVVRQSLNPLRITVSLNEEKFGGSHVGSSGSNSPLRSLQNQLPFQTLNSGVSEILKSVPEPLRDALSKLSLDLTSKATSSAPGLAEFIEKMKMIYLNELSDSQAGPRVGTPGGNHQNTMSAPKIGDQNGSKITGAHEKLAETNSKSTTKDGKAPMDHEVGSSNSKNKAYQLQKVMEALKLQDGQPPRPVDLNVPYSGYGTSQSANSKGVIGSGRPSYSQVQTVNVDKKDDLGVEKLSGSDKKKDISCESSDGVQAKESPKETNDSCIPVWMDEGMLGATNQCPFSGMPLSDNTNWHAYHHGRRVPPFKRSYNHGNGMGSIFHPGVRCDGCGVHPIAGPRFKSKVKNDYDLCSICFAEMGNGADYIRLDRPANHRHPFPSKGSHHPSHRVPAAVVERMKLSRSKLDSRFILDVNVLDGTIMAPSTKFTKIWRMRNNGNVTWPRGSQLLWIGGDRLSDTVSVEIEIPAEGLSMEKELDIAVDFTAPELPGRYISYWKMASPSGQKFGQRVWVLIQVDAPTKDLGGTSINLNLPPFSYATKNPEVVNAKEGQDPLMGSALPENNFVPQDPFSEDQETNFPINDALIIDNVGVSIPKPTSGALGTGFFLPAGAPGSSIPYPIPTTVSLDPVSYPTVDFPTVTVPNPAQPTPVAVQPPALASDREETLLRELEEMGFKQIDLNKEILRMNEYDLERSVDDLCGVFEWDPILDELQEMGFSDKEENKRLLKKNNGSIKGVVMDLINGETP